MKRLPKWIDDPKTDEFTQLERLEKALRIAWKALAEIYENEKDWFEGDIVKDVMTKIERMGKA